MHSSKIASCWLLDRRVHKVPVTLCCNNQDYEQQLLDQIEHREVRSPMFKLHHYLKFFGFINPPMIPATMHRGRNHQGIIHAAMNIISKLKMMIAPLNINLLHLIIMLQRYE